MYLTYTTSTMVGDSITHYPIYIWIYWNITIISISMMLMMIIMS